MTMIKRCDLPSSLAEFDIFASLDADALSDLANRVDIVRPERGELVVQHLDKSDDFYLVLSGQLTAILISGRGREVALGEMQRGTYFGEIAAIGGGERTASIFARTPAELARLPARTLRALIRDQPGVAQVLLGDMVEKVRNLTQRSFELTALKLADRLTLFLVRAGLEQSVLVEGGELRPAPTHAEIAAQVGANREAVSRELSVLAQMGIIGTRRGCITFFEPDRLIQHAHDMGDIDVS